MKTMGLIGGMSWESTQEYYRIINETVKEKLGGFHSAKCILYSVDFAETVELAREGKWAELTALMIKAAQKLERADAEFIIICTNTIHKLADDIQKNVNIPILHIVDAVSEKIVEKGLSRVGLLGTKYTMEEDFYKNRLQERYNIGVIIPNDEERDTINSVIYNELCLGTIRDSSKESFKKIINLKLIQTL